MFKVLVVDDTRSVHSYLNNLFAKLSNIQTTDVFDGLQAIQAIKEGQKFDLILLDWEMPNLNGPSTLEELKRLGIRIPTVMMTTKSNPEDILRMLDLGVAEYMIKPFTLDILIEKIEFASGWTLIYAA